MLNKYALMVMAGLSLIVVLLSWRTHVLQKDNKALRGDLRAKSAIIETHEKNIKEVEKANETYQNNITARDARIISLSKRPAKCVTVKTSPASGTRAGGSMEQDRRNGMPDSVLYGFAGRCEGDRLRINSIKNHRELNK